MGEECDLESLTALLDDSDMEDDLKETDAANCQDSKDDGDGCDLDEITAFLEQSDSDDDHVTEVKNGQPLEEVEHIQNTLNNRKDLKSTDVYSPNTDDLINEVKEDMLEELVEENDNSEVKVENNLEVDSIQAELLEMQRKMQELQERLSRSKTSTQKEPHKKLSENDFKSKHQSPDHKSKQKLNQERKNSCEMEHDKTEQKHTERKDKQTKIVDMEKHRQLDTKHIPNAELNHNSSLVTKKSRSQPMDHLLPHNDASTEMKTSKSELEHSVSRKNSLDTGTQLDRKQISPKVQKSNSGLALQEEENPFFPSYGSTSPLEKSPEVLQDRKTLEKSLFGDDDDSDWEPMEEDDKIKLSDEGHELSKMIKDSGKTRHSIVTPEEVAAMRKKAQKNNWKHKNTSEVRECTSLNGQKSTKENEAPCLTDPFSGIRIVNPKISSIDMKARMMDRKLVKISNIDRRVSEHDNWVTIGVIVFKSEPRQSSTGKTFCIWKLSDLMDCDKTISFFLFGEVYKQHWKNEVTSVVGILNPNLMDKAEKIQNDMAFTVSHPGQVMVMGYSKDYGRCSAMTGKGNNLGKHCTNFINKQQGEFCTFHVQKAYSKKCSQRTELQGSYSGMTPSNHKYKPKDKKDSFFFYQGQTYTTGKMPGKKDSQNKVTIDKLKQQQAMVGKKKVTTMSLHAIDPEDVKNLQKLDNPIGDQNSLLDMLTVPTPGSMNFVKHLITKDKKTPVCPETGKVMMQSVTAADLLKQHKLAMRERRQAKTSGITLPPTDPLKCTPTLGRGLAPGGDICLDITSRSQNRLAVMARKKAVAKVQAKGGLVKEDPNAVKKMLSPEAHQKIKKRILESNDSVDQDLTQEPPRKKSKLLGNIDEDSKEFKELMKARSKHTGALAEVEAEVEERYFMEQEKKERLEDKMAATMEIQATVFTCKQCNYTAFKVKDECKQQNHNIVTIKTKKRFFKCKKCGNRTTSIHKLPTEACKNCGENTFERVSMLQERKGPKLPHENLCIRGDEIKFIGSMNEKVYL